MKSLRFSKPLSTPTDRKPSNITALRTLSRRRSLTLILISAKELSLYDTGVSAEYGDKLITLSTCEYSRTNGRLVVVAKKVTESSGVNAPANDGRQRYRANALIKKLCANYDDGNCLLLDEGEGCVCVQSISYSLLCRYFRNAVLPADPALEAEILGTHPDRCVSCGAPIIRRGNRKKYCEKCANIAYKRQQAEYAKEKAYRIEK